MSQAAATHLRAMSAQLALAQFALAILALAIVAPRPARADVLFYSLPGDSGLAVTLEGTTGVNPGGTVTYTHPKFGKIHFDRASVDIRRVPTLQSQFSKQLN